MSSFRAARIVAGLGVSGALAATGLVVSGPGAAHADTPTTQVVSATYTCSIPVVGTFDIPVSLTTVPVAGSFIAGQTIPQLPITDGTLTVPAGLLQTINGYAGTLSALLGSNPLDFGGALTGSSTVGTQAIPTTVTVPTQDITSVLSIPVADLGSITDMPVTGLTGTFGAPAGTVLTATGTNLPVSLPASITADLLPALNSLLGGAPTCTTATPATVGTITVAKATSKFTKASFVSSKVSAKKKAQVKATLANTSPQSVIAPNGSVTAYVGAKKVGSGALKNGAVKFNLAKLKKGSYKVVLKYAGSAQFKAAASKTLKLKVTK